MRIAIYITMLLLLWTIRDFRIFRSAYDRRARPPLDPNLQQHRHRLALFLLCVLVLEIAVVLTAAG